MVCSNCFICVESGVFFVDAKTKQICTIEKAWMEKEELPQKMVMNRPITPVKITIRLSSASAGNATYLCTPNFVATVPTKMVSM